MSMSIFNKRILILLLALALGACASKPDPAPQPLPEADSAAVSTPAPEAESSAEEAPASETEAADAAPVEVAPVDYNQQFYEEAIAALKSGDTDLAIELLVQVSNDAPDKPFVFTNLGLAYFKLQQLELAEQAFKQALARDDDDAVAHNHLGILQRHKGQFEEARDRYQRAIDINGEYARAHLNLGILFDIYLQDLQQALQHYRKYQSLINEEDSQVAGWIVDIERRLKSGSQSQG